MPKDTLSIEFRHESWWDSPKRSADTVVWLRDIGAVHTIVDGPQGAINSVPTLWEPTHPDYALLRVHGRNVLTYNAKVQSAAERFEYDYLDGELAELVGEAVRLAYKVKHMHVIFNNCHEDKGQRNAQTFINLVRATGNS